MEGRGVENVDWEKKKEAGRTRLGNTALEESALAIQTFHEIFSVFSSETKSSAGNCTTIPVYITSHAAVNGPTKLTWGNQTQNNMISMLR